MLRHNADICLRVNLQDSTKFLKSLALPL